MTLLYQDQDGCESSYFLSVIICSKWWTGLCIVFAILLSTSYHIHVTCLHCSCRWPLIALYFAWLKISKRENMHSHHWNIVHFQLSIYIYMLPQYWIAFFSSAYEKVYEEEVGINSIRLWFCIFPLFSRKEYLFGTLFECIRCRPTCLYLHSH